MAGGGGGLNKRDQPWSEGKELGPSTLNPKPETLNPIIGLS